MRIAAIGGLALLLFFMPIARAESAPRTDFKFMFGSGKPPEGFQQVRADALFSPDVGFGFEPNTIIPAPGTGGPTPTPIAPTIREMEPSSTPPTRGSGLTSDKIFLFSVAVPDGNYRVTLTLGDASQESMTTVKAESRLLMLERIHTNPGEFVTKSFLVNVHGSLLPDGTPIKLDAREKGVFHWDNKLTLEFLDTRPALVSMEIHKVDDAVTVFVCGDSTVTNQVKEPYGTWGQMLPRWFNDHVAVAIYAESGETVKAFRAEHRWDKVMSELKPGDFVFMQFGHNDLNKTGHNAIWPADDHDGDWAKTYSDANTDYKKILEEYATEAKAKGAIPVIVSPMTKIDIRSGQLNIAGLKEYPQAAVAAAKEAGVACIDLNAMSIDLVKALGPDEAKLAYVEGLHSNSYGGYLFSRCIIEGIRQNKLGLAEDIVADAGTFDPTHPLPLHADFKLPLEPGVASVSGRGRGRGTTNPATTRAN